MIRIVIENIFFFLLPTLIYIVWIAFTEDEWAGLPTVLRKAPLLRLFVAGAALMFTTLILFSSRSGNRPQDIYVPPSLEGGKLEPGRSLKAPEPELQKP
jgi:hypothetical protein